MLNNYDPMMVYFRTWLFSIPAPKEGQLVYSGLPLFVFITFLFHFLEHAIYFILIFCTKLVLVMPCHMTCFWFIWISLFVKKHVFFGFEPLLTQRRRRRKTNIFIMSCTYITVLSHLCCLHTIYLASSILLF